MLGLMFTIVNNMNGVALSKFLSYEAPALASNLQIKAIRYFEDISTTSL
jgi:hypothetical protein